MWFLPKPVVGVIFTLYTAQYVDSTTPHKTRCPRGLMLGWCASANQARSCVEPVRGTIHRLVGSMDCILRVTVLVIQFFLQSKEQMR